MYTSPLRIGVIGVGFGAVAHIPGFQSEGIEVLAVCASREERAREAADKFGVPHAFTDFQKLLEMPDLDAVSIATPHHLHREMAVASLEAGKHVLCEKPFAVDVEEAEAMREAARRHGDRTAMLGHLFRWAPQRAYVKELLNQGYIGELQLVQGTLFAGSRRARGPRRSAGPGLGRRGGLLWSIGSHYLDCYRHWFGDVSSVQALQATHLPNAVDPETAAVRRSGADDAFSIIMEFRSGGWGSFTASNAVAFGQGAHIEIFGSEGSLATPQPLPLAMNPPPDGRVLGGRAGDTEQAELPMPQRFRPFDDDRDHRLMAFRLMVREFLRGIREGESPAPNFEDGYRLQQVLDAAVESADTGRRVSIPLE